MSLRGNHPHRNSQKMLDGVQLSCCVAWCGFWFFCFLSVLPVSSVITHRAAWALLRAHQPPGVASRPLQFASVRSQLQLLS